MTDDGERQRHASGAGKDGEDIWLESGVVLLPRP